MRDVLDKGCRQNQIHALCSVILFQKLWLYDIMFKIIAESDRPQITI